MDNFEELARQKKKIEDELRTYKDSKKKEIIRLINEYISVYNSIRFENADGYIVIRYEVR